MTNHSKEMFALMDRDGNLIGKDDASGGYPWVPSTIGGVWLAEESKEMLDYAGGSFRDARYRLVKVSIQVEVVVESKPPCAHPWEKVLRGIRNKCLDCGEYI